MLELSCVRLVFAFAKRGVGLLALGERANACVNDTADYCRNCDQSDIAFQKRNKNESYKRDSDSYPVNQRLRNQVQRDDCDYAYYRSADPGEERLKSPVFAD